MRVSRSRSLELVLLLGLALQAPAAAARDCKLLPPIKPVKSLEALAGQVGGLRLEVPADGNELGDGYVTLSATGELGFHAELGMRHVYECPAPVAATFRGPLARASCPLGAECEHKVFIEGTPRSEIEEYEEWCRNQGGDAGQASLLVSVQAYSPTVLRGQAKYATQPVSGGAPRVYVRRRGGLFAVADAPLIQLVAGARDRTLHEEVARRLLEATGDDCPLVVQGPPAVDAREHTEIYYVGGDRSTDARELARRLEPIIGPVEVKAWPGKWDYDLVVVTGATRAQ